MAATNYVHRDNCTGEIMRTLCWLLIVGVLSYWAMPISTELHGQASSFASPVIMEPNAAKQFQRSINNGWYIACRDKGEYDEVLRHLLLYRKVKAESQ